MPNINWMSLSPYMWSSWKTVMQLSRKPNESWHDLNSLYIEALHITELPRPHETFWSWVSCHKRQHLSSKEPDREVQQAAPDRKGCFSFSCCYFFKRKNIKLNWNANLIENTVCGWIWRRFEQWEGQKEIMTRKERERDEVWESEMWRENEREILKNKWKGVGR